MGEQLDKGLQIARDGGRVRGGATAAAQSVGGQEAEGPDGVAAISTAVGAGVAGGVGIVWVATVEPRIGHLPGLSVPVKQGPAGG